MFGILKIMHIFAPCLINVITNLKFKVMKKIEKLNEIKNAGTYLFNGCTIDVTEITTSGKIKGTCTFESGESFAFTNSASGLRKRIENNGITPKRETTSGTSLEKQYIKLQKQLASAILALNDFQSKYGITNVESARRIDEKRKERKKARNKESRDEKIKRLIKKAREYKQLERAMKLTDVLLE